MSTHILETLKTISSSTNYNAWLFDSVQGYIRGDVLDVGSGVGDMAALYRGEHISSVTCSDHSQDMVSILEERFKNAQKYHTVRLDISQNPRLANTFDTITCLNVLEHIPEDTKALKNMQHHLRDQGRLILLVPALHSIFGTLDKLVGHCRRYNQRTLAQRIQQAGLKIERIFYVNFFGIFTWFLAGRILKRKSFDGKTCRVLDKIVPMLQFPERFICPPIGQSLIAVCSSMRDNH